MVIRLDWEGSTLTCYVPHSNVAYEHRQNVIQHVADGYRTLKPAEVSQTGKCNKPPIPRVRRAIENKLNTSPMPVNETAH